MNFSKIDTHCYNISNYKNLIRRVLLSVLFAIHFCELVAQPVSKPPVGPANYGNWPYVNHPAISDDGRYAMYLLHGNAPGVDQQVVRATVGDWQQTIGADTAADFFFSANSRWLIYRSRKDSSLRRLRLGSRLPATIIASPIHSFKASTNNRWLAFHLTDAKNSLILEDFVSNRRQIFTSVRDYYFSPAGKYLIMVTKELTGGMAVKKLSLATPHHGVETLWHSQEPAAKPDIEHMAYGPAEKQLAFLVQYGDSTTLWYGMEKGSLQRLSLAAIPPGFSLALYSTPVFNSDGSSLFLYLQKYLPTRIKDPQAVDLDIWHYQDERTPGQQISEEKSCYLSVLQVNNGRINLLETGDLDVNLSGDQKNLPKGKYVLARQEKYLVEHHWQLGFYNRFYLISTEDGRRRPIPMNDRQLVFDIALSPDERFVTWYNHIDHHYYSYEIITGQTRDITGGLPFAVHDDNQLGDVAGRFGIAGWLVGDERYLVYDRFDIWGLDPTGLKAPLNLTHGYGRRKGLILAFAYEHFNMRVITPGDKVLLTGFNRQTKENGFFTFQISKEAAPEQKCLDPYIYFIHRIIPDSEIRNTGECPLKAAQAEAYIVRRMSAESSPNYFFTKDFKTFHPISSVYPEQDYNWLSSEIVRWKQPSGQLSQGILYKPENFNPLNKYPVIFYYYREKSDGVHRYIEPEKSSSYINIPQYVSNGYLVFVPDITAQQGSPGQCTLEAVESAARYLSSFSWVDAAKLGVMGHSYGGYETNYIVTHSRLFAAACSGSGPANLISYYGGLYNGSGTIAQRMCETAQINLGVSFVDQPERYIENSPIFKVRDAVTPLLIWQGAKDGAVPAGQAVEMYLDMRRAGKKVWLLMYNTETHGTLGKSADDLDVRMRQFFDHYLKGVPPAQWMTQGRPTSLKGIDERLAPDISGAQP